MQYEYKNLQEWKQSEQKEKEFDEWLQENIRKREQQEEEDNIYFEGIYFNNFAEPPEEFKQNDSEDDKKTSGKTFTSQKQVTSRKRKL
jgi:hypothetical protein